MKKLVSIIVPVYNMGHVLEDCIKSLLKQTYSEIEIIIIDDGSIDNTVQVCEEYGLISNKIKFYHIENSGSGAARNYGIKHAHGDFIYFMDADDILEPNAIEILVNTAIDQQSDLIVFGYRKVDKKGNLLYIKQFNNESYSGEEIRENYHLYFDMNFKLGIQGPPWNKFFDLKLIQMNNIKYPSLKRHQDEVFISRYMSYANNVSFINNTLYTHYLNDVSSKYEKFPVTYIEIVKQLYEYRLEIIPKWNKENQKVLSLIYMEYIYNSIKAFDIIFSKKASMSKKQRIEWIKKETSLIPVNKEHLNILKKNYSSKIKLKQISVFLKFIEKKQYFKLYILFEIRWFLETKLGWFIQLLKKSMVKKLRNHN